MSALRHYERLSLAALLLVISTAFALNLPDYFLRSHVGSRARAGRQIRADDQDHDHSIDALSFAADLSLPGHAAGGDLDFAPLLPFVPPAASVPDIARDASTNIVLCARGEVCGRAPPRFA
jgi:hypothetical protein